MGNKRISNDAPRSDETPNWRYMRTIATIIRNIDDHNS